MAEAHPLMLYNTLTRRKEVFKPIDPANVRMYVCGPTVYDYAHIGNARPVIVFDVLFRLLRHLYGPEHVTYVRNITDVDDKINARAAEEGVSIRDLTERTATQFHEDIAALGVLPPTVEPRATEHIAEMKALIEALVANGHAYVAENHVLFHVPSMPDYGRLSNRSLEEMEAGARVEVAPYKKDPMDFVLWKPSKPGEPSWPSPCGIAAPGRPGWHIECSAMAERHLGQVFDIHGGGIDLVFPHHENEIAQSRCAHGTPVMARYWLHNGFLQVEGEKMSKSLGNFITIHELLKRWPGDVIRLQMLMTHYRQPLDWTETRAELARNELEDWAFVIGPYSQWPNDKQPTAMINELCDDLNTPGALTLLREQFGRAKKGGIEDILQFAADCHFLGFRELGRPGLFQWGVSGLNVPKSTLSDCYDDVVRLRAAIANNAPEITRQNIISSIEATGVLVKIENDAITLVSGDQDALEERVRSLLASRAAARKAKDFKEADRIRDELAAMGIALKDSKDPKTGEIVTTWEARASGATEASR